MGAFVGVVDRLTEELTFEASNLNVPAKNTDGQQDLFCGSSRDLQKNSLPPKQTLYSCRGSDICTVCMCVGYFDRVVSNRDHTTRRGVVGKLES